MISHLSLFVSVVVVVLQLAGLADNALYNSQLHDLSAVAILTFWRTESNSSCRM